MPEIRFVDVTKIYPFQKVNGLFYRKEKQKVLDRQLNMPYTSNEGVIAVQHTDLVIRDGRFTVILGPSGSGKSTLLRIIAGLETATLGDLYFDDQDMRQVKAEDRDVAMVFQNYSLYPGQTVYQNIAFPLEVKHVPREEIEPEVKRVAAICGISDKLEELADDLSGGEKQRTAIARAIIRRPQVLLFDEPFANLDPLMRQKLREELKAIHKANKTTIVYVTHDQYDALALADDIVILKDGIIQMKDTAAKVYNEPANRFCGEFLGDPQMNIFENVEVSKDGMISLLGASRHVDQKRLKKAKNIDVGIRAGDIMIGEEGTEAVISYCEVIEADLLVHVKVNEKEIVIREKAGTDDELKYLGGQTVRIKADLDRFHLFAADGKRI